MDTTLAANYVERRMREMGYPNYLLRHRELVLGPSEHRDIDASGELFLIIGSVAGWITIESDLGVYNTSIDSTNELAHEHTGLMIVRNPVGVPSRVQFLQAIPLNRSNTD